jgi:hypothetical protein
MPHLVEILKSQFNQSVGVPWQGLLPESRIDHLLAAEKLIYCKSVYTPFVTLWCFISQSLDPDKSFRNAVARIIAYSCAAGVEPPSKDTGAYAKARGRFNEEGCGFPIAKMVVVFSLLFWCLPWLLCRVCETLGSFSWGTRC